MREFDDLLENPSNVLLIHYSSESFYDKVDGRSARITSIAVRFFNTGQSESFSIHKTAEKKDLLSGIEEHYDTLEKIMLDDFFKFLKKHENFKWIHWNMRDMGFGFQAINHRFDVLGGKPTSIIDHNKFDLPDKLKTIFGQDYIGHPRFKKLAEKNNISMKDFMLGVEEVAAFENKEYVKLHHSTLRKANMIHSIAEKMFDRSLKTEAKWYKTNGFTPQGIFELVKGNWFFNLIIFLLGILSAKIF